jgi:hypothetical protein
MQRGQGLEEEFVDAANTQRPPDKTAAKHNALTARQLRQRLMDAISNKEPLASDRPQPGIGRRPQGHGQAAAGSRGSDFAFVLLVIATAVLFARPMDLISWMEVWPLYQIAVLACLALCLPCVLQQMTPESIRSRPITACVLGLLATVLLSELWNRTVGEAWRSTQDFLKLLIDYLLIVGLIDTQRRLRQYLFWLTCFIGFVTALALLQYHGVVDIAAISPYRERQWSDINEETGQPLVLARLCGTGLFENPNDLSRILVIATILCVYWLGEKAMKSFRLVWLGAAGMFGYALSLTYSRGGLLGLAAGMLVLLHARLGGARTLKLAAVVLPALLLLFGGRQTRISTEEETAKSRMMLWREGLTAFQESPVIGNGVNSFEEITGGLSAHNSFINSFTELGLIGGTFFCGAFYLAVALPYRLGRSQLLTANPDLDRIRSCVVGILASYIVGMFMSSRNYTAPTFTLLGLGMAYTRTAAQSASVPLPRFDARLICRLTGISSVALCATYVLVRLTGGN